ncbi:MAG: FAD-binding oxidoreductase [Ignavibacteria bacterium]
MIIKTEQDEIQIYLSDASNTKGFCSAVWIPENAKELSDAIKEANLKKLPVTISGNRTGLTGASVPNGGIVISTEKFNKIIEINREEKFVITEPGVLLSDLQDSVNEKGLLYPPDPTERNCFIGGTVATNASGARTFKYGATRDYVLGLEILLVDGDLVKLTKDEITEKNNTLCLKTIGGKEINLNLPDYSVPGTKNASGYFYKPGMDAIDLFIGSEGTLGIITKIKLKLIKVPTEEISCILFFNDEDNALNFLVNARQTSFKTRESKNSDSIDATALEYFDEKSLNFLKDDYSGIPLGAKAAIWFEQICDGNEDTLLSLWIVLFNEFGGNEEEAWFALTDKDKQKIIDFRHSISANVNEYVTRNNFRKLGTDVAVPDDCFNDFYKEIKGIVEDENMDYVIYGHFGNSHIHLNMLPKNETEFEKGKELYKKICLRAIEVGGTFSAEHGVGKNKTEFLRVMYGEENINAMREIKKTLDPNYILGVGNIFKTE